MQDQGKLIINDYLKILSVNGIRIADGILQGKLWLIKVTLISVFCALFFSFPSYDAVFNKEYPEGWKAVQEKSSNPLMDMTDSYGEGSHDSKLTFRLTVPIIAHYLHLKINGMIVLQFLAGVVSLLLCAVIVFKITRDKLIAFFATLLLAGTYAGTTAFVELRGIFDGVAIFFLLISLATKTPLVIASGIFLAAWTDERGLAASIFIFLYHALSFQEQDTQEWKGFIRPAALSVIAGAMIYLITRIFFTLYYNLNTPTQGVSIYLLIDQFNQFPMGTWTALEWGWLLPAAATYYLWVKKLPVHMVIMIAGIIGTIVISLSVVDITRSMAYMIPVLFIAIKVLYQYESKENIRGLLFTAGILSLLSANYYAGGEKTIWWQYPFPLQILRWVSGR